MNNFEFVHMSKKTATNLDTLGKVLGGGGGGGGHIKFSLSWGALKKFRTRDFPLFWTAVEEEKTKNLIKHATLII